MTVLWDMHRLGPAPTWERELVAAAANLAIAVLVGGLLAFVVERPLFGGVFCVLLVGHVAVRLAIAARRGRSEVSR